MATRPSRDPRNASALAGLRLAGAVALDPKPATPPPPPPGAPGAGAPGPAAGAVTVVDVTEETFATEVLERSERVPVVIDFWAAWCGPCKQLSPILERLAAADGGRWVLAKIDVDANPRLAQAAQVQGIPAVKAVVSGQVVGEFTGAVPEPEVRSWLDQLLTILDSQGGAVDPAEVPADPDLDRAEDALGRGDLEGAAAAFQAKLDAAPGDKDATIGLAQVELLRRIEALDPAAVQARATADPDDIEAALGMADLAVAAGEPAIGLTSLVELVGRTAGDDRDRVRTHLLGLFTALGEEDPAVPAARRALARALF